MKYVYFVYNLDSKISKPLFVKYMNNLAIGCLLQIDKTENDLIVPSNLSRSVEKEKVRFSSSYLRSCAHFARKLKEPNELSIHIRFYKNKENQN